MKKEHVWQYISDTHDDSVKIEPLLDMPPAKELRIHITRFQPGAGTDPHTHEWEHAMYFMGGTGKAIVDGKETNVKKGILVFVPRNAVHVVLNTGTEELVVFGVSGPPRTEAGYAQLRKAS